MCNDNSGRNMRSKWTAGNNRDIDNASIGGFAKNDNRTVFRCRVRYGVGYGTNSRRFVDCKHCNLDDQR